MEARWWVDISVLGMNENEWETSFITDTKNEWSIAHLSVVKLPVNVYLTLSNVTSKIRSRVSDVWVLHHKIVWALFNQKEENIQEWYEIFTIIGHSQDRDLGNGTLSSFNTPCTLINSCKICVHITRISTSPRYFFSSSRDLQSSKYFRIRAVVKNKM